MAGAPKGNKNGAKKNRVMTDALRRELLQYEAEGCARGEAASVIARKLIGKAIEGDKEAAREIYDRLDGKAHQTVDMTIDDNRAGRDELAAEIADLHARLAGRSDGRGAEPPAGPVPSGDTTH